VGSPPRWASARPRLEAVAMTPYSRPVPDEWWPIIEYREFYDVPHDIVVRASSVVLYLVSEFDFELDDYRPEYTVYQLPETVARSLPKDWSRLSDLGTLLGTVPVSHVAFDPTTRARVASAPLVKFLSGDKLLSRQAQTDET
jgi:hypothetical protein